MIDVQDRIIMLMCDFAGWTGNEELKQKARLLIGQRAFSSTMKDSSDARTLLTAVRDGMEVSGGWKGDDELYSKITQFLDQPVSSQHELEDEEEEARRDAWNDFFNDYLTDGNDGYVAGPTIERCRKAFYDAWPAGRSIAFLAATEILNTSKVGIRINGQPATPQDVVNIGREMDAEDGGYPAPPGKIAANKVVVDRKLFETAIDDLAALYEEINKLRPGTYRARGTVADLIEVLHEHDGKNNAR